MRAMRLGRTVFALALMLAGFVMANAVDAGVTRAWPDWERGLWAWTLIGSVIGGIRLLMNGLGILTTEVLNDGSIRPGTEEPELTVGTFVSIYVAILVVSVVSALVLKSKAGIPGERTILVVCGAVFLVAASGRPWWLYATVRRVHWFALIRSDRAMRVVLATLGTAVILAGTLMKV